MLWLNVSIGNLSLAYCCTALASGELGSSIAHVDTGLAGLDAVLDSERRGSNLRGTAVQPYFSIAGLLMMVCGMC